jgi:hypothetical protein
MIKAGTVMADDDFRSDGTIICPVHGMRYDPALTTGCIRCPRTIAPGKRSAAPSRAPASKSSAPASVRAPSQPPPAVRPSAAPLPFDPAYLGSTPYQPYQQPQQSGPVITLLPGPQRRSSRRGLLGVLGLLVAGGAGAAAWILRPEGATDWASKITTFRYGPNAGLSGSLFVPTAASERPCPLLLLLDPGKRSARVCARFARHCEEAGWICAASDAFGNAPSGGDHDAATLFLEAVRTNASVDGGRPVVAGYDTAGETACRLALLSPDVFSGALLECCSAAPWRDIGALARSDVGFFLFTRVGDAAREGMLTMKDEMQRKGLHVTYDEIPGGHEPMTRDELDPAFAWLRTIRG